MSCYFPQLVRIEKDFEAGVTDQRFLKKSVHFLGPFDYDRDSGLLRSGLFKLIPCGKCIGCKLDYAREWSNRLVLEMDSMKKGVFVTLTYEPKELPQECDSVDPETGELVDGYYRANESAAPVAPLVKFHVSEFLKRLRSQLNYKANVERFRKERPELINNPDGKPFVKIRFFAAGEYGDLRHRPHYHIILFGLNLEDLAYLQPLFLHDRNELGQETFRSPFLESVWEKGIVGVSEANYLTMGYTARYTVKKALGNKYPEEYGLPAEFTLMSRNPGIGASFLKDKEGITDDTSVWFDHGKEIYWPKYLREKEHEIISNIEVFSEDGFSEHKRFRTFDQKFFDDNDFRQDLSVQNLVNLYEYDERPYKQVRDLQVKMKYDQIKKLSRGDGLLL